MKATTQYTKDGSRINITESVIQTVRAIGKGHITTAHVTWAINSQLTDSKQITEAQVQRTLNEVARRKWMNLTSNGHGCYRYC